VNVNALALARLSGAALQAFSQRHRGVLINVSSSAALQPLPLFAVYSASKAFVSHLTEAAMSEVGALSDVSVMNVVPSGTDTALQSSAGVKKGAREKLLSPEFVADRIACLVLRHGASGTYFIGTRGRVMDLMARLLPRRFNIALWGHLAATRR
jgi:short-subunit dehydrogenase